MSGSRSGQFWVLEDHPPGERARWYCHDRAGGSWGFDDVDEAVAFGLARAATVVVRTVEEGFWWVGQDPRSEAR